MPTDEQIEAWAASVGVSPDIGYAFVRQYGRLPQSIPELDQFLGEHANEPAPGTPDYEGQKALIDAELNSNREKFEWDKESFNRNQYGQLGMGLLNNAASLRGPRDWNQYSRYTSGGKGLMDTLYGTDPRPDFQAPFGELDPVTIGSVLADLGLGDGGAGSNTGGSGAGGTGGVTEAQIIENAQGLGISPAIIRGYVQRYGSLPTNLPALQAYMAETGARDANTGQAMGRQANALETHDVGTANQIAPMAASLVNRSAPAVQMPAPSGLVGGQRSVPAMPGSGQVSQPASGLLQRLGGGGGSPVAPGPVVPSPAPLPVHYADNAAMPQPTNIRPIVWDSLSPFQQEMALGSAETQGWDASEFLRRINSIRPPGQAARQTASAYAAPRGY